MCQQTLNSNSMEIKALEMVALCSYAGFDGYILFLCFPWTNSFHNSFISLKAITTHPDQHKGTN